jgi:hypothetical protein
MTQHYHIARSDAAHGIAPGGRAMQPENLVNFTMPFPKGYEDMSVVYPDGEEVALRTLAARLHVAPHWLYLWIECGARVRKIKYEFAAKALRKLPPLEVEPSRTREVGAKGGGMDDETRSMA